MYSSIDLLVASLEGQVKKGKDKVRRRRPAGFVREPAATGEISREEPLGDNDERRIIRAEQVYAKPMDLDEAVMQMNLSSGEFLVFTNRRTSRVNVLYHRKDGNLGLIETIG